MMGKLKRLLNGIEQAGILGARCQSLEQENADLKSRNASLWDSYNKKNEEAIAIKAKFDEVNSKVREQTEADLMLTSLKIIQGAMRGEKRADLSALSSLQQQQMATYQGMGGTYGGLGFLGGLGGIGGMLR